MVESCDAFDGAILIVAMRAVKPDGSNTRSAGTNDVFTLRVTDVPGARGLGMVMGEGGSLSGTYTRDIVLRARGN